MRLFKCSHFLRIYAFRGLIIYANNIRALNQICFRPKKHFTLSCLVAFIVSHWPLHRSMARTQFKTVNRQFRYSSLALQRILHYLDPEIGQRSRYQYVREVMLSVPKNFMRMNWKLVKMPDMSLLAPLDFCCGGFRLALWIRWEAFISDNLCMSKTFYHFDAKNSIIKIAAYLNSNSSK